MNTQCTLAQLQFHPFGRREVVARFDAGHLSSDAGAPLLREADRRLDLTRRMAECFADARQSGKVEHTVAEPVAQRARGLALGYEDLNDHDRLRCDPLLALAAEIGMDAATGEGAVVDATTESQIASQQREDDAQAMQDMARYARRVRKRLPPDISVCRAKVHGTLRYPG